MKKQQIYTGIVYGLIVLGVLCIGRGMLLQRSASYQVDALHALQDEYYHQSKAVRDGAATNSDLNDMLVAIEQAPATISHMQLMGIARILGGIGCLLLAMLLTMMARPRRLRL